MNFKELLKFMILIHGNHLVRILFIFLLLLAIANEIAIYNIGLITGDYYKIMNNKDRNGFFKQTMKSIGLIIGIALLKALKEYVGSYLYIEWRRHLTTNLHQKYLQNMLYYHANVINSNANDNVDQRITQDIDKMTNNLSYIVPEVIVSPFIIIFYGYKCYDLNGFVGPIGCLVFFLISTLINRFLILNVSKWVYKQEQCEGDFRAQHFHIRHKAEAIAFLNGDNIELTKSNSLLTTLINVQRRFITHQLILKVFVYLCDYFGSIMSFIALSVPLFAGAYDNLTPADLSQLISQNVFFTMYLINCFTRLIDLANYFSIFFGTANRIVDLYRWFGHHNESQLTIVSNDDAPNDKSSQIYMDCTDLCVNVPQSKPIKMIIQNLTLQLRKGQNLLITGPSGIGKSSLLRTWKQIWSNCGGHIDRKISLNDTTKVMFLPQKPLLTVGSIVEQITYPFDSEKSIDIPAIIEILQFLELDKSILERVNNDIVSDQRINWIDHLSVGEVQRLILARVLYHRPILLFMDESTSALPLEMEEKILRRFQQMQITMISCGHRDSLKAFHHIELNIESFDRFVLNKLN
ncbi:hypothetical protein RDWZM_000420 [Blomia tropicalis]|uniref:Uncharacterized protein n=1 Tax=Blomia tropicalis TaxID=40697 RepID=A0A9Q0RPR9_BLOTA|nr:hypothetical protein RDWZM_000420 [Blomia tropicalis]